MLEYINQFDFQESDSKLSSHISQERADKILEAIKKDSYKSFIESTQNLDYKRIRFGRFPILTLIYFFSSRKLERKLEIELLDQTKYDIVLPEPTEAYNILRDKSRKALRIYTQDIKTIVSPLEALIIMGRTFHMRRKYPFAKTTSEIKTNLTNLYYLKYSRNLSFNGEDIEMERRNLTKKEKINIVISAICLVVIVAFCADLPVIINLINPTQNQNQTDVDPTDDPTVDPTPAESNQTITDGSLINFSSTNTYTLANDISIDAAIIPEEVTCNIDGDGHAITFSNFNGTPIKTLSGVLSNINLVYTDLNIITSDAIAFICERNNGTISNINLTLSGNITANKETSEEDNDTSVAGYIKTIETATKYVNIAGLTLINTGTISDCTVTANLTLSGNEKANSTFSGVAFTNTYTVETVKINDYFNQTIITTSGSINNCVVNGTLTSNLVDLAGICNVNYTTKTYISNCTNNANLSQTTTIQTWNPMIGGIIINNNGTITKCINNGNLTIIDTYIKSDETESNPICHLGGIVAQNFSSITLSNNNGNLSLSGKTKNCFVGGIAAYSVNSSSSSAFIQRCINAGEIHNSSTSGEIYTAGISAYTYSQQYSSFTTFNYCYSTIQYCFNEGEITATTENASSFTGGIAGVSTIISYCRNSANINSTNSSDNDNTTNVGGISGYCAYDYLNSSYPLALENIGTITVSANNTYVGGIIGQSYLYSRTLHHTISNCSINVTSTSNTKWSFVGGIVGYNNEITQDENTYLGSFSNNYSLTSNITVSALNKAVGTVIGAIGNYLYNNQSYENYGNTYYYYTKTYYVVSEAVPYSIGSYNSSTEDTVSFTAIGTEIAGENTSDSVDNITAIEDYTNIKIALDNYYSQITTNQQ